MTLINSDEDPRKPGYVELVPAPAPAQGFSQQLTGLIVDPSVPAEKLELMLKMRRELLQEQREEAFKQAYIDMHAAMPQVEKEGWVELAGKGRYPFMRWEDMDTVVRPIMHDYRFALTFREELGPNGGMILCAELMHRDGHSLIARRHVKPDRGPGRNDTQAEGSGLSYAKRYLAEQLLNIVRKGQDDDGIGAEVKPLSEQEIAALETLLKETNTDKAKFLNMFTDGCEELADIPPRSYARLHRMLTQKKQGRASG